MQIWVDADACPRVIKEILFRAARRLKITITLVANQPMPAPPSPYIKTIQVTAAFDAADDEIAGHVKEGDLVITADIPLAASVIKKGAFALNPRGELYTEETIHDRLSMRNLMDELRGGGEILGGPSSFNRKN
ncbi:MAG: YaiI/YqxD family protein, partial [Deltaproteobacteria bacterium]|nr:YaiI/YqxD family protein [Deltaproteobacteria bacterium]